VRRARAERPQDSLNKDDSKDPARITTRLIEMQEEAAGSKGQLMINVPLRGHVIELRRALEERLESPAPEAEPPSETLSEGEDETPES